MRVEAFTYATCMIVVCIVQRTIVRVAGGTTSRRVTSNDRPVLPSLPPSLASLPPSLLPSCPPLFLLSGVAAAVCSNAMWRPLSFSLNARQNIQEYEYQNISIYSQYSNKIDPSSLCLVRVSLVASDTAGATQRPAYAYAQRGGGYSAQCATRLPPPPLAPQAGRHTSTNTLLACDTQGERTCIAHRTGELGQSYEACSRIITYVHTHSPSRARGGHGGRGGMLDAAIVPGLASTRRGRAGDGRR